MTKLPLHTTDKTDNNIKKIVELFPNVLTEVLRDGKTEYAIDFDVLRQELSKEIVEGAEERYQFTWPDKRQAVLRANAQSFKTLRPCREESVDFDNTENLYIEGDNLDVLKLLQETYLGKVKMIYIDPPYNTGKDFIYPDKFNTENWDEISGEYDEDGYRMVQNLESNGQYHTDWLNIMYPRLRLAKDLLKDDGVIFISIDDNEVHNLRKICDEVFGAWNFVAQLIWERAYSPKNDAKFISNSHDYVLMYAKSIANFQIGRLERTEEANARYQNPDNDPRGVWKASDMSVKTYNVECDYPITAPSGRIIEPPASRCWSLSKKAFLERLQDNRIWFGTDGNSVPSIKRFISELKFDGMAPTSIMFYKDVGHSQEGAKEVVSLFDGNGYFDGPKPVRLLRRLLILANLKTDDIILDFFSGSATTAHAVMQLNAEDGGNRKFIMVQIPEVIPEKHEAYKAGYRTICDIGKERIRRAGAKINAEIESNNVQPKLGEEAKPLVDIGFRVLKVDSTNMKDVYYYPEKIDQQQLELFTDNIKEDRTPEDLLFQVMLDLGAFLSCKVETETIDGKRVFVVYQGSELYLIACFDKDISMEVVTAIAKRKPYYAVFRDASMESDSLMASFEQIFEAYSNGTVRRVL